MPQDMEAVRKVARHEVTAIMPMPELIPILFDDIDYEGTTPPLGDEHCPVLDLTIHARKKANDDDEEPDHKALEEVELWLDAVALCFNLPEGRRWIDP